ANPARPIWSAPAALSSGPAGSHAGEGKDMCIMAMAWHAHPRWRLLLVGNRDELHARPAAPLARWDEPDHLIAGRDLQSGGTWLGVSEQGRCAIVTNRRGYGLPDPAKASRGALVTDLLRGEGAYAAPDRAPM